MALVFRPPVSAGEPMPDLSRRHGNPLPSLDLKNPIIESYDVTTIDRQVSGGWLGRTGFGVRLGGWRLRPLRPPGRRTEKVGVLHR